VPVFLLLAVGYAQLVAGEPAAAGGYDFPELTGRVVDQADLLSAEQETQLSDELRGVEERTEHQFVVVTVSSLGGHAIEDYGLNLGNSWGIGRKDANDGVLLIVAPIERKVRIEVSYGLETTLTDDEAKRIIDDDILPRFRTGDMAGGIEAGAEGIIEEIAPEKKAST
jgi:uncharacterized protein